MNNKLIITVTLPILMTLGLQAYMLFQLNKQVYHLSGQINQASNSQITVPKFSSFTPLEPRCGNEPLEGARSEYLNPIYLRD